MNVRTKLKMLLLIGLSLLIVGCVFGHAQSQKKPTVPASARVDVTPMPYSIDFTLPAGTRYDILHGQDGRTTIRLWYQVLPPLDNSLPQSQPDKKAFPFSGDAGKRN